MNRLFTKQYVLLCLLVFFCAPALAFAQEAGFVPLTGVPGVDANNTSTEGYISALYALSIGAAAALAIVKIIMAGMTLMTSDIVPQRSDAKKQIGGALIGLILILGAVTILNEVNPRLTTFDIFQNAEPATAMPGPSHSEIRDEIIEDYPVAGPTFEGTFGSTEHVSFIRSCRASGGKAVAVSVNGRSGTVECRFQES